LDTTMYMAFFIWHICVNCHPHLDLNCNSLFSYVILVVSWK
jgi:hypothetical protein